MKASESAGRLEAAGRSRPEGRAAGLDDTGPPAALGELELPPALARRSVPQLPSGRHNLPRELVIRSQRSRIVDAMAQVVARKGYAEATVAEIIAEAGVSRATFYQHYESKAGCFDRAVAELAGRLRGGLEAAIEGEEKSWPARIARALGALVEAIRREPELAGLFLAEAQAATPRSQGLYEETMAELEAILDRSQPPSLAACPTGISRATVSGIAGVLSRELSAGRAEEFPVLLPCLIYWAIAPYEGREAAFAASGADANRQMPSVRAQAGPDAPYHLT